ncbi:MAG: hypothetical protein OXG65_11005 [Chloroflexi bacterium]|nr:hypothetical protein [Chloroflexota bacterium]
MRTYKNRPEDLSSNIDNALQFVLPSIDLAARRFAAIDTRIQRIITVMATVTVGVPIAVQTVNPCIDLLNPLLFAAVAFGVVGIIGGAFAHTLDSLKMILIQPIYKDYIYDSSHFFKKEVLRRAGIVETANLKRVKIRAWVATGLSVFLGIEILLFVLWLIFG